MNSVRQVVSRSPKRAVGIVNAKWFQGSPIEFESLLEKSFIQLCLLSPAVRNITHQPFRLPLSDKRWYIPDFLLTLIDGARVVVEVKPLSKFPKYIDRFDQIAGKLLPHQLPFLVAHDKLITWSNRHRNAARILRYRIETSSHISESDILQVVNQAPDSGILIAALQAECHCSMADILHLIATRKISVSRDLAITNNSPVFSISKGEKDATFQFFNWIGDSPWRTNLRIPAATGWTESPVRRSDNSIYKNLSDLKANFPNPEW
ncbi:MAG: hypothetical protein KGM83_00535 [Betaproteobacteria bacterium]|nr:hypothetical protein [Betaproteobacteria bacterium]